MARVAAREEELRQWVFTREAELKKEMMAQEEATQQAVAAREVELEHMWNKREALLRAEIARKDAEIAEREEILKREAERLHRERISSTSFKPTPKVTEDQTDATPVKPQARTSLPHANVFETPVPSTSTPDDGGSAMKGVIMADGQPVATPAAAHRSHTCLDQQPSSSSVPSSIHDAFTALDERGKENSPPGIAGPPSPSSVSTTSSRSGLSWHDKTPQPRTKKRISGRNEDLTAQLKANNPSLTSLQNGERGMQRTMSAPVGWGTGEGDDDDVPSPFLKRADRAMAKTTTMGSSSSSTLVKGPMRGEEDEQVWAKRRRGQWATVEWQGDDDQVYCECYGECDRKWESSLSWQGHFSHSLI
ncbi:hypothetical protein PIIN_10349 [Serendipita indica DSM 11827]|uniref:Uncharacterized protein n=1 Tax=Serendipita indica (strain DSM 11827) TaxID=1109443 RepID=G4TYG3_SERID|nr:hypothetical protein PIIN_10349 [Serendipita indica DSM 11827]